MSRNFFHLRENWWAACRSTRFDWRPGNNSQIKTSVFMKGLRFESFLNQITRGSFNLEMYNIKP